MVSHSKLFMRNNFWSLLGVVYYLQFFFFILYKHCGLFLQITLFTESVEDQPSKFSFFLVNELIHKRQTKVWQYCYITISFFHILDLNKTQPV